MLTFSPWVWPTSLDNSLVSKERLLSQLFSLVLVFPALRPLHLSNQFTCFPSFWVNGCSSKLSNHLSPERRQERLLSRKHSCPALATETVTILSWRADGPRVSWPDSGTAKPVDQVFTTPGIWSYELARRSASAACIALLALLGWRFQILVHHWDVLCGQVSHYLLAPLKKTFCFLNHLVVKRSLTEDPTINKMFLWCFLFLL